MKKKDEKKKGRGGKRKKRWEKIDAADDTTSQPKVSRDTPNV